MWFWTVVDRPCRSRSRQCDRQRITAQDDERSATGSPSSYAHRLRSNRPHSAVASPRSAGNWRPIWGEVAQSGSRQRCRSYSSTSQSTTHVTEPTASRCTSTASTRNLPRGSKKANSRQRGHHDRQAGCNRCSVHLPFGGCAGFPRYQYFRFLYCRGVAMLLFISGFLLGAMSGFLIASLFNGIKDEEATP
jgi:hypothetical protein